MDLFPHQVTGVSFLGSRPFAFLWDSPGLGKTAEAIVACDAVRANKILVICPAVVRRHWEDEFLVWQASDRTVTVEEGFLSSPPGDGVTIVSHATLSDVPPAHTSKAKRREVYSYPALMQGGPYDVIIVDECFPYDTPVVTDRGVLPIGQIVENKLRVHVRSFNREQNVLEWKPVVRWLPKAPRSRLMKVTHERGSFVCTPEHNIATSNGGYAKAEKLRPGETLYFLRDYNPSYRSISHEVQKLSRPRTPRQCRHIARQTLRYMREAVFRSVSITRTYSANLRQFMRWKTPNGQTGSERSSSERSIQIDRTKKGSRSCICKTDAREQPYGRSCCQRENASKISRQEVQAERRQRQTYTTADSFGDSAWAFNGVRDFNESGERRIQSDTQLVQSGYSRPDQETGDRNRRPPTCNCSSESQRPSENRSVVVSRVVSVEVLELGSGRRSGGVYREGTGLYDIEVADNHNYFADGVLVSNCHLMSRNIDARRSALFWSPDGLWSRAAHVWALTGTPVVNSAADLWLAAYGPLRLPVSWWDWCNRFAEMKPSFDGPKPSGILKPAELAALLRPYALRRTLDSVGIKLPPLSISTVPLAVPMETLLAAMAGLENWTPARLLRELEEKTELHDAALARVRRALGIAKVPAVAGHVHGLLASGEGPVVVFFQHTDVRKGLYDLLSQQGYAVSWIDGKVTQPQLRAAKEWFQAGRLHVLLVQVQAGGVGLTLTRGNRVVVAELPWTSVELNQAVKRLHRIGQTRPVTAEILRAQGSWLDDVLANVVTKKQRAADSLLNLLTTNR